MTLVDVFEDKPQVSLVQIEPDGTSLTLLQKVYRCEALPLTTRMRAAMAALQFEHPKLGVSVNIADDGTFAARLEAAIQRTNGHAAKVIEGSTSTKVIEHQPAQHPAAELREPLPTPLATPLRRRA